jgi:hypothetical protein
MRAGFLGTLTALTLLAVSAAHGLEWRFPGDRISFEQWTTYFDELANTNGAILTEESQYYIINLFSDLTQPALYVFTKPSHPAYPAVVIRSVESREGRSSINRRGHYAGDQAAFDKWWREFDALDKKTIENAKENSP